jgi:hypothetical protein
MFPIIEKTLSTRADVPDKDIANSTILEILLHEISAYKSKIKTNPRQS